MLSESFLDELRSRLPVSAVVGRRVGLTKKGNEHQGLCPFHNEKSPSFTVNDLKGFYHCFGCGAHGDVISFEMQSRHLSFTEAVEQLAEQCGLDVPRASPEAKAEDERRATLFEAIEAACAFFEEQLRRPCGQAGMDYLTGRGLEEGTISRFRLGFAPNGDVLKLALVGSRFPEELLLEAGLLYRRDSGGTGDIFRSRVMFPITDRRGRLIGFGARLLADGKAKYINTPTTPIFDKGASLYGLAHAREAMGKENRAVVMEGYMDVITAHQAGFSSAVAPLGTAFTERQMSELWRMVDDVVMCLDGDDAGQKAMAKTAERMFPELQAGKTLRFAVLPEEDDPDSLIRAGGAEALEPVLAGARPLIDVTWDLAVARLVPDTPERLAAFEAHLYRLATGIRHEVVRRRYLAEFRRRLRYAHDVAPAVLTVGRSTKKFAPAPFKGRLALEWAEAVAAGETNSKFRDWLDKQGLGWERIVSLLGGLGVVRAKAVKSRWVDGQEWGNAPPPSLWEPCEAGGEMLAVIPAWEGDGEDGVLMDLIGWNLRTGELHQRSGYAHVLGQSVIDEALGFEAQGMPRPVQIADGPLSWLRFTAADFPAVLVVDWRRAWDTLGGLSELEGETVDLGKVLEARVRPPRLPRPKIFVLGDA